MNNSQGPKPPISVAPSPQPTSPASNSKTLQVATTPDVRVPQRSLPTRRRRPSASSLHWSQFAANIATLVAAIATLLAIVFGYWTFERSAQTQRDTTAISVLQSYHQIASAHPEFADAPETQPITKEYEAFAQQAMFTAEIIYNLQLGDAGWEKASADIVEAHKAFICHGPYRPELYSSEFRQMVAQEVKCS